MTMGQIRKSFQRPSWDLIPSSTDDSEIRTLQDLVLFNAAHNTDHVFCCQSNEVHEGNGFEYTPVTFWQLAQAVEKCCSQIITQGDGARIGELRADGSLSKCRPIALFFESSVTLFIYTLALTTLQIPVSP